MTTEHPALDRLQGIMADIIDLSDAIASTLVNVRWSVNKTGQIVRRPRRRRRYRI